MSGMRGSIIGILILALTVYATGSAEAVEPTPELVARQFEAAVYGDDFGTGRSGLLRWKNPVVMHFGTTDKATIVRHANDITNTIDVMAKETGLTITADINPIKANVRVAFLPRSSFGDAADNVPGRPISTKEAARTSICFGVIYGNSAEGIITAAAVLIATDISDSDRRDCIPEELVQMMGLMGDACHYRPSLICEDDEAVYEMQPADRLMLAVLYDPALRPGMTKDVAMPIARRLIRERWAEYMAP
ncbi:MAG: DUF2927 domain-containing protein [Proteobacteria bacterium]|nr:DUF2927 domain-containing protein [Pseudomonadota bacterium]